MRRSTCHRCKALNSEKLLFWRRHSKSWPKACYWLHSVLPRRGSHATKFRITEPPASLLFQPFDHVSNCAQDRQFGARKPGRVPIMTPNDLLPGAARARNPLREVEHFPVTDSLNSRSVPRGVRNSSAEEMPVASLVDQ